MTWYRYFAGLFFLPGKLRKRAYVKTYKAQLDRGRRDAEFVIQTARTDASNIRAQAEDDATAIRRRAETDGRSREQRIVLDAGIDAATIRDNARKEGFQSGRREASREIALARLTAIREGSETGRLAAYCEAARQLNLEVPTAIADIPTASLIHIERDRCFPNIYRVKGAWVVRVIREGAMHYKEFIFKDNQPTAEAEALIRAASYRDSLAPNRQHYATIYDECLAQAVSEAEPADPVARMHIRVCELFHLRVQQAGSELERVAWSGEDPEDRLGAANTSILVAPWPVLFDYMQPKRVTQAFAKVGLNEQRTVRDLLMITADDLLDAGGFGPVSLNKLRQGLTELGLALWGDPAPAVPVVRLAVGDREFRAINID